MKLKVLHEDKLPLTKEQAAKLLHTTPDIIARRLARMKRRNPKLESVTIQRLIWLTKRHSSGRLT